MQLPPAWQQRSAFDRHGRSILMWFAQKTAVKIKTAHSPNKAGKSAGTIMA
jgi:hypothetical protein